MNALIIAQHHGCFLTLQSAIGKFDRVVVFVPQTQLDKYAGFPEPVFTEYGSMLKEFCKKHKFELHTIDTPSKNQTTSYISALRELKGTGVWAVLGPGAIYQNFAEEKLKTAWFSMATGRLFDGDTRLSMYAMVGLPASEDSMHIPNFFLNLDNIPSVDNMGDHAMFAMARQGDKIHIQSRMGLGRPDPLVTCAISSVELCRLRTKSANSAILHYWMAAITKTHVEQEYLAYPFDEYAKLAKKVKKYLPTGTLANIIANGEQSEYYLELARRAVG